MTVSWSEKKRGRLFGEKLLALDRKIYEFSRSVFLWFSRKHDFISQHYFFDVKIIKECSNYPLYYFLISSDKYVNKYFWRNFILPSHLDVYLKVPFCESFLLSTRFQVFIVREQILSLLVVLNVKNLWRRISEDKYHVS